VKIVLVSSEVHPFSKTGGLADVASALPMALAKLGHEVTVVSPWYKTLKRHPFPQFDLYAARVWERMGVGTLFEDGVRWVFLSSPLFERDAYYGYWDDAYRFTQFSLAVPHALEGLGIHPDVVHLNDWQTGLIAPILRFGDVPLAQRRAKTVFTIHNLAYQGRWGLGDILDWTGLPEWTGQPDGLEMNGDANLLKAGVWYANRVSTVSPRYAWEVTTPEGGVGLDGALRARGVTGILNGIDTEYWNPATDQYLEQKFSTLEGKMAARVALCKALELNPARPTVAMITRLSEQKGLSIFFGALEAIAHDWNIVILGSGDSGAESALHWFQHGRSDVYFNNGFNEPLAHRIYAGADAFLMPSLFEPCGLAQMISMRYGTVPIVRHVGGLLDTVPESRGYTFSEYSSYALLGAIGRAKAEWGRATFTNRALEGMKTDVSWDTAARQYTQMYSSL
jgi:starch synthase